MARYISLYSGSSGNCSVVEENGKFILIDIGKSARTTHTCLKELGLDIHNLQAVLISHEHSDHIGGLRVFLKNMRIPVYSNPATLDYLIENNHLPPQIDAKDMDFGGEDISGFFVKGFATPHDSLGCMGYRILTEGGSKMGIVTDLGTVTEDIYNNLTGVDLAVVESNYDQRMLDEGPYPYYLKKRIASGHGHLSNAQSSQATVSLIESGVKKIHLCHLSQTNNTAALALSRVVLEAQRRGIVLEKDVMVKANMRNSITPETIF